MRKRERQITQVFWGRQAIGLLDSQVSSRVRTHLSGPLTSEASRFPLWIPEGLDWPQGPQISFILFPNTPTAISVLKSPCNATFTTCMLSARPLRSGPQFPHMSHELIRPPACGVVVGLNQLLPESAWNSL